MGQGLFYLGFWFLWFFEPNQLYKRNKPNKPNKPDRPFHLAKRCHPMMQWCHSYLPPYADLPTEYRTVRKTLQMEILWLICNQRAVVKCLRRPTFLRQVASASLERLPIVLLFSLRIFLKRRRGTEAARWLDHAAHFIRKGESHATSTRY